jgi:Fe-S-cluster containining protein
MPNGTLRWLCSIYDSRPGICKTNDACPSGIDVEIFHQINASLCNQLQEQDEMPRRFRVEIGDLY